jgi:hypothetical protein
MIDQVELTSAAIESDFGRWGIPNSSALIRLGAKPSGGGTHITRTMMLDEITRLLIAVPIDADATAYRAAVIEQNVLSKATESTRQRTYRHLRELYGLDPSVPLFSLLRHLVALDEQSLPLIAVLVAWARDPQFRSTTTAILDCPTDRVCNSADIEKVATPLLSAQYGNKSIRKIAKNASASWSHSGHLTGGIKKVRRRVQASPAALTLALFLSHLSELHGDAMFGSIWCRLLDLTGEQARSLAAQAHREGLINLRVIGAVVEISFPRLQPHLEAAQ